MTTTTSGWRLPDEPLLGRVAAVYVMALAAVVALAFTARAGLTLGVWYPLKATAIFGAVTATALGFIRGRHPFTHFGPANSVTTARAALVALVAGLVGEPAEAAVAAGAAAAAFLVTAFDGVDGWIARRSAMSSEFGARFDMEVDALLGLALALLAWQHERAGVWILLAGLLRYIFVLGGWLLPWLRRPLPPSRRRQAICVVQLLGLGLVIVPAVPPEVSSLIALVVVLALGYSFGVDLLWLGRAPSPLPSGPKLEYR